MKLLTGKNKIKNKFRKVFKRITTKTLLKSILYIILCLLVISFIWGLIKPIPAGTYIKSNIFYVNDSEIKFLSDLTINNNGTKTVNQEIFSNIYDLIDSANEFIVIDMFLFGEPKNTSGLITISSDFKDKLIEKKKDTNIPIYFITDDFNTFYKSSESTLIKELKENNITIIYTNLNKLRDSNPLLSAPWRIFVKPFGSPDFNGGLVPNFLGEGTVSLRSVFTLLNFKANHRKVIFSEKDAIISSANPHTGSSLHSNVAIRVSSKDLINVMLDSEKNIAKFSNSIININNKQNQSITHISKNISIQYITEKRIEEEVLNEIKSSNSNDSIQIGMFYFSNRQIVSALKDAKKRGVNITLVLDANKDAFGKEKNGIPNRQVAYELEKVGITIFWYKTNGEQFHTKIFIKKSNNITTVILGSGNYTRRNIGNFNLEADLKIVSPNNTSFSMDIKNYWDDVLKNVLDYKEFKDTSKFKYLLYRFQEWSGLSTF